jgi:hypothetical protein
MSVTVEIQAGPRLVSDGSENKVRGGRTGEIIVSDAHGRHYEATSRGNVFFVADQTGKTVPAGLSASPTTVTLFNPKLSGVNVALISASIDFIVAFAAGSAVWLGANVNPAAADVTGTAAVPVNALVGSGKKSSILAFTAATLPAAPIAICQLGAGLTGAITTAPVSQTFSREFAGSIVVGPGGALSFQASTAGGASGGFGEFCWEEVPLLSQ